MKHLLIPIFLIFGMFLSVNDAQSDSFYSSIGLGMPRYYVSPKAVGMGGAGIGLRDRLALNTLNPGALAINSVTTLALDFEYESVENSTSENSVSTHQGRPSGFRFVVPIHSKLNVFTALVPLTYSQYVLSRHQELDNVDYTRLVRGSGGLSAASLGITYVIGPWLSLGLSANYNFGNFHEEWKIDFTESSYRDASDKISTHFRGVNYDLGVLIKPYKDLSFGFCYKTDIDLGMQSQIVLGSGIKTEIKNAQVHYPAALGMGCSVPVNKVTMALDYYFQPWSDYSIEGDKVIQMENYYRIGGGMEFLLTQNSNESYYRRVSYRIGAYHAQLPFTNVQGAALTESFVALGFGLPFRFNAGRVDLAVEIGRRGSLDRFDYKETIVRFSGCITSGELWFQHGTP
jgi:hypothetical protein